MFIKALFWFLALCLLCHPLAAQQDDGEIRALLKAPLVKETGVYVSPANAAKLRALLTANPKLANQPIFQLRGQAVSTPLVEAAKVGNVDAVRALLDFKAKPNLALAEAEAAPLEVAIVTRLSGEARLTMVRLLLAAGAHTTTSLHAWATCTNWTDRKTYFAAADALIAAKTALNGTNETGATPLQVAVVNDNVLAVEKLAALGATVDDLVKDLAYAGMGTPEGDQIVKALKLPVPRPLR
jgi:ankyrin repeat protein